MVQRLVQLAAGTSGRHAAGAMHRLLELGESHGLKGCEITLFDGLDVDRRIDIDDHAYLAPYRQVEQDHGPPVSALVGRRIHIIEEPCGKREGLKRAAALVRELRWGPAVVSDSAELHRTLVTEFPFCLEEAVVEDDWSTYQLPSDQETFRDLLSIATENHVIALNRYTRFPRWMESFDPLFKAGWSSGRLPEYVRRGHDTLTDESAKVLLSMIGGWRAYRGDRKLLGIAVRRLADSRSRIGRSGTEDRILDTAIALETMYRPLRSRISHTLATRASRYLGNGSDDRSRMFEQVRCFYKARSDVIHGPSKERTKVPLRDAPADGFRIARMTLIKLLEDGDAPSWDELVTTAGGDDRV